MANSSLNVVTGVARDDASSPKTSLTTEQVISIYLCPLMLSVKNLYYFHCIFKFQEEDMREDTDVLIEKMSRLQIEEDKPEQVSRRTIK